MLIELASSAHLKCIAYGEEDEVKASTKLKGREFDPLNRWSSVNALHFSWKMNAAEMLCISTNGDGQQLKCTALKVQCLTKL
jgi:hypothetical protein